MGVTPPPPSPVILTGGSPVPPGPPPPTPASLFPIIEDPSAQAQIAQLSTANYSYESAKDSQLFTFPYSVAAATIGGYTFVPVSQLDRGAYGGDTAALSNWSQACKATVYTMIARAVGDAGANISQFWDLDNGASPAALPANVRIGVNTPINDRSIIELLSTGNPVIIGGTVNRAEGGQEGHWMLATSVTQGGKIVANDPWTGMQVIIDPSINKVIIPSNYALRSFIATSYQTVTIH